MANLLRILPKIVLGVLTITAHGQEIAAPELSSTEFAAPIVAPRSLKPTHWQIAQLAQMYISYDVTRGVNQVRVYQNGDLLTQYSVNPPFNELVTRPDGSSYCAFATVGMFRPSGLHGSVPDPDAPGEKEVFKVELDPNSGFGIFHIGTYQWAKGYATNDIRQPLVDIQNLFMKLQDISRVDENGNVLSSEAIVEVTDNTPGIKAARQSCIQQCLKLAHCQTRDISQLVPAQDITAAQTDMKPGLVGDPRRLNPLK